ncbi:MAG: YeeE/YedE family protein [Rhodothermales bacterium]|nr:YeeE/YedE family protein [Rhodothermales bacterium]
MEPTRFNLDPKRVTGYLVLGILFGLVLVKSEVVSWFRIQEMFRFDSFHMYGVLGSGVAVAAISLEIVRRLNPVTATGQKVEIETRAWQGPGVRYIAGGTIFGLGWALLGACPGPIYALIGTGISAMVVALLAAIAGAWAYGSLQQRLPH